MEATGYIKEILYDADDNNGNFNWNLNSFLINYFKKKFQIKIQIFFYYIFKIYLISNFISKSI